MVGTEGVSTVGEQLFEDVCRTSRVSTLAPPVGKVITNNKGIGVVGPENTNAIGEEGPKSSGGSVRVPGMASP